MKPFRELPRYDVTHLRGFVVTTINNVKVTIPIKNVSLAGIHLTYPNKIVLEDWDVEIHLIEKKPFLVRMKNVWNKTNEEDQRFSFGNKLHFKDVRTFQRWLQIMKALHLHRSKKK